MSRLNLGERDRARLAGEEGEATALAMRVLVRMAEIQGARGLLDVTRAHIDGCLYHGRAGLDFAERLVAAGGRVAVPTTLNVGSLDLLHPDLVHAEPETLDGGRRLMDAYAALGCSPTWTCAPYQLPEVRPGRGEHVAWAESNAIVFANSVLGARTDRYGDFIDICAAITGRAPDAGLHRTEHRRGEIVFHVDLPDRLLDEDAVYPLLGHVVGAAAGSHVPVLVGPPPGTSEDRLKALGAAAASSGSVALFHVVGVTPEAPDLDAALQGRPPIGEERIDAARLRAARDELTTAARGPLRAVSLGTPHYSVTEFERLVPLVEGLAVHPDVECYVSTGRDVLAEVEDRGWLAAIERAGIRVVADTCTYVTPILRRTDGVAMTDSGKWAYYAPGNIGVEVVFGTLDECLRSAAAGEVVRDEAVWADG